MSRIAKLKSALGLVALFGLASPEIAKAQSDNKVTDDALVALALSGWEIQCGEPGCLMFRDVPIGDPKHPFDAEDPQFITIAVAVERQPTGIAYIAFKAPPDSDTNKPLGIKFVQADLTGLDVKILSETKPVALPFQVPCKKASCDVRIPGGVMKAGAGTQDLEVFALMMSNTFIQFTVTRKGIEYSPLEALLRFQNDYRDLLKNELSKQ